MVNLHFLWRAKRNSCCVHNHSVFWVLSVSQLPPRQTGMFVPPSQRFLVTFAPSVTRLLPALCFAQYTKILQKKRKSPEPGPTSPPAAPLSAEQVERIARNKRAALAKLTSAQTPPGFGEGWRDQLSAEFGKAYFKQVRDGANPNSKLFGPV